MAIAVRGTRGGRTRGPKVACGVMCDCLCALAPATAAGITLFAKNSDRPPREPQVVERHEPRVEPTTHTTHTTIDGAAAATVGFVGSRPRWAWSVEHGVNDAGVAAGN